MAIQRFSEKKLTAEVIKRMRGTKNKRLKQVMTSFVKHMHAFVRDVKPTPEEWMAGIQFLTETGHWCTGKRQEFILMSDTLGVSMLEYALGDNISKHAGDGEACIVSGTVKDAKGRPIGGAKLDIWEGGADGLYD